MLNIINLIFITFMLMMLWTQPLETDEIVSYRYLSPSPNAQLVSAGTTIALRQGEEINVGTLTEATVQVSGNQSGRHTGKLFLADDKRTIIFEPHQAFTPGESVQVSVYDIETSGGKSLEPLSFSFTVSPNTEAIPVYDPDSPPLTGLQKQATLSQSFSRKSGQDYVTVPDDFPEITLTSPPDEVGEGYLFMCNVRIFPNADESKPYLLIVDNSGEPVYYKRLTPAGFPRFDFRRQQDYLTYWDAHEMSATGVITGAFFVMDSSYTVVDTYPAGNGYHADFHDFELLPNGHGLLMIYDPQPVDMSAIVPGGDPNAIVIGLVIQELDQSKNVVFEWRSWDHIPVTDTTEDLTTSRVDYVHGNDIEVDFDGNLLVSSRHLNEITKIDRDTGEIIWRMGGGKGNQFTFVDDPNNGFFQQHDVSRLPNGNLTLFDNRRHLLPEYSRVVEYDIDEINRTAQLVWSYRADPDIYAEAMAGVQRLPNGNTVIGWGTGFPTMTEVKPDGNKAFELTFTEDMSYRVYRFPWEGKPTTSPTLVVRTDTPTITLYYSWNGATNIQTYQLYGGSTPNPTTLIDTKLKSGFETTTVITNPAPELCYFRVMPVDQLGKETQYSNIVSICKQIYIPVILK